jgi:hypothetical protein
MVLVTIPAAAASSLLVSRANASKRAAKVGIVALALFETLALAG